MDRIELRPVTIKDAKFLYQLLKDRPKSANISHSRMPTWKEHLNFIKNKGIRKPSFPQNYYVAWYIIGNNIGSVYITELGEIGIAITKKHQGKGFASVAIKKAMKLYPYPDYFLANVAPGNKVGKRLFKKLGFSHIQNTYRYYHARN